MLHILYAKGNIIQYPVIDMWQFWGISSIFKKVRAQANDKTGTDGQKDKLTKVINTF